MLEGRGLLMRQGTIPAFARTDAAIIAAPPSTKNKSKRRDPEMHQTKKGNQWHVGMKAHIGVDAASGVVHMLTGTAANEADINQMAAVLHGREEAVFADAGYTGADKPGSSTPSRTCSPIRSCATAVWPRTSPK